MLDAGAAGLGANVPVFLARAMPRVETQPRRRRDPAVPPIDLVPAREPHLARLRGEVPVDAGVAHAVGQRAPDGHLQRVVPSLSPPFRFLEAATFALPTVHMLASHTRVS